VKPIRALGLTVLVEFSPGVAFPKHSHPGEELVYVVKGKPLLTPAE